MYNVKDALLAKTIALPDSPGAVSTVGIQVTGDGLNTDFVVAPDVLLELPALTATQVPNTKTVTYTLETSDSLGSGYTTLATVLKTGSSGIAASKERFRLASDAKKYVRLTATTGADTTDCSDSSATIRLVF